MSLIHQRFSALLPQWAETRKQLSTTHKDKILGEVLVEQVYGGMRGCPSVVCDTSYVDPMKGLIVRGIPIAELTNCLPEEIFWLLLIGTKPTQEELKDLQADLRTRQKVPDYVWNVLAAQPADANPMAMFCAAIVSMQRESNFYRAYTNGAKKSQYWESYLDDSLDLLARLPSIAAGVYRMRFHKGTRIEPRADLDWAGNFAHMLGIEDDNFKTLMRLFLTLHSDHGGGNVSAFTSHVVSSALSDIYYASAAGLGGLAGPLHGLANQLCLQFVLGIRNQFQGVPSDEQLAGFIWKQLETGPIFGYGHAVLRAEDPRFTAFYQFGKKHCGPSDVFQIVDKLYRVVPPILIKQGKAKNPWPNIDAASGSLLYYYGLTEMNYYTVLFGLSRVMGFAAQSVIHRGLGSPIFRPRGITTKWLQDTVKTAVDSKTGVDPNAE